VSRTARLGRDLVLEPKLPLQRTLTPAERELADWLRDHTPETAVVVIEPTLETDGKIRWQAFERLIERPTLVNQKFVPSQKADIARWYRLVLWRRAVFGGNCSRLSEYPVDYLVSVSEAKRKWAAGCGDIVWENGPFAVIRVARPPALSGRNGAPRAAPR
jgi:hypothetical protein